MITICCGFIFLLWNIIVPSIKERWTLYGTEHLWNQSLTCPESQHSSFEKLSGKLLLTNSFIFTKLQERSLIDIHVYGKVTKHKLEKKHTYKMFIDNNIVKKKKLYHPRCLLQSKIPVAIHHPCYQFHWGLMRLLTDMYKWQDIQDESLTQSAFPLDGNQVC